MTLFLSPAISYYSTPVYSYLSSLNRISFRPHPRSYSPPSSILSSLLSSLHSNPPFFKSSLNSCQSRRTFLCKTDKPHPCGSSNKKEIRATNTFIKSCASLAFKSVRRWSRGLCWCRNDRKNATMLELL